MAKIKKKKALRALMRGVEIGVGLGVLLALERHGKRPFDGGHGCTYRDFKKMLKREYLVEIDAHDFEAIIGLFNIHPKTKVRMENAGKSVHHPPTETDGKVH